jgi:hypothetical protein
MPKYGVSDNFYAEEKTNFLDEPKEIMATAENTDLKNNDWSYLLLN